MIRPEDLQNPEQGMDLESRPEYQELMRRQEELRRAWANFKRRLKRMTAAEEVRKKKEGSNG